ncbi:rubredoxin domain-containing protein [Pedobacter sp. SD-b]|uniref:Rubredoxin domain-containing protein n=1 Tax=Pedobacter segetis TaxID=2793069 RepID=A0ABS1BNT8_9SPHI|nr:rubredoxin [Pedobacter segetis]MBK0384473.1 rubredoxin domain-containing protein [Pedobacter segetis]
MQHIIKINLPGGIVSPGDLAEILEIAEQAGVKNIRFGNRQQLFFLVDADKLDDLSDTFLVDDISFEVDDDQYPNIISSYVTEEILNPTNWLREGVYKDILNGFSHRPKLKINIVDHSQNLIPFFTGHLNFISSETSNFWYLHIRFPKSNFMYRWPVLVYTEDIPELSKVLEQKIGTDFSIHQERTDIDAEKIFLEIKGEQKFIHQNYEKPLTHTDFQLPYYEGFNKYNDKFWLGIYRRKEEFAIDFLKEICEICAKTRLGQIYTTAWKSLVIKSINHDDRKYWSHLLNKYRINVRHAANELNWSIEDVCDEALALKIDLVKSFEEADLRTYRLCFAIKTKPNTGLFASVIIRKINEKDLNGNELYEVLHSKNFNPNNKEYVVFAERLIKSALSEQLIALSNYYYSLQLNLALPPNNAIKPKNEENLIEVYQCKSCKTIYDETMGDQLNDIKAGTKFNDIKNYHCPLCEAPKEDFEKVKFEKFVY